MPEDRKANLNDCREAIWLDEAASRSAKLLRRAQEALPAVIGHCDWWAGNVRWEGERPLVVHDWDSLVALPEAAVAGVAAAVHQEAATVEESAAFLAAYEAERGTAWTPHERQVAWAAGLWCRAFDAKKQVAEGGGTGLLVALQPQTAERLRLAGIATELRADQR